MENKLVFCPEQNPSLIVTSPGTGPLVSRIFIFRGNMLAEQAGEQRDGEYWGNCNDIYICPECGVEWARIIRLDRKSWPLWNIDAHYCDRHMDKMWWAAMPGCFGRPNYPYQYHHMPRSILIHDFLKLMELRDSLNG